METYYVYDHDGSILEILLPKDIRGPFKTKGAYHSDKIYKLIFFCNSIPSVFDTEIFLTWSHEKINNIVVKKISDGEYEILRTNTEFDVGRTFKRICDLTHKPYMNEIEEMIKREVNECYFAVDGPGMKQCESHFLTNS